jgi:mRNA interferase RelE/StbE
LSNNFKIAETFFFKEKVEKPEFKRFYSKILNYIYPILKKNPFYGKNIKKLKGEFEDIYRYRIGDVRVFYKVEEKEIIVFMIDIEWRKDSYK